MPASLIPQPVDSILAMAPIGMPRNAVVTVSLALECILYGISIFMFLGTISVLLLILSTAHVVVSIIRADDGLVMYRDTFLGGPTAFFDDFSRTTYSIKSALYVTQTLLADGVVIYRCYVAWQSARLIILPCMLWCSVAATDVYAVHSYWRSGGSVLAAGPVRSGSLAYRTGMIERHISTLSIEKTTLMPILRVLVDPAVLYTAVLCPALICFLNSNTGEVVVVDMAVPIMSIAFYMVLIRIAINRNRRFSAIPKRTTSDAQQGDSQQYPVKSLQLHVSQFTHSDGPSVYGTGTKDRSSICRADFKFE